MFNIYLTLSLIGFFIAILGYGLWFWIYNDYNFELESKRKLVKMITFTLYISGLLMGLIFIGLYVSKLYGMHSKSMNYLLKINSNLKNDSYYLNDNIKSNKPNSSSLKPPSHPAPSLPRKISKSFTSLNDIDSLHIYDEIDSYSNPANIKIKNNNNSDNYLSDINEYVIPNKTTFNTYDKLYNNNIPNTYDKLQIIKPLLSKKLTNEDNVYQMLEIPTQHSDIMRKN